MNVVKIELNPPIKPKYESFGLTEYDYQTIRHRSFLIINRESKLSYFPFITSGVFGVYFFSESDEIGLGIFLIMLAFTVTSGTIEYLIEKYQNFRLGRIVDYDKYCAYEEALRTYSTEKYEYEKKQEEISKKLEQERLKKEREEKRRQHQYWMSIDPYEFEREIALLFEKQGYKAYVTKGSGDGGIDIKLDKSGERGIVQCKRFKTKVGPGPIRDLYGTMKAGKYKYAFIVCPSGFSDKAYEFSKGKNIKLVGLKRIMEMVDNA